MKDYTAPPQFDDNKRYLFQVCHPSPYNTDKSLEVFTSETSYPKAIKACIAMIKEFDLPWATLIYDEWSRTIYPNSLWLENSGILISERLSVFRDGKTEKRLLIDEPLLKRTSFGWGFYDSSNVMDGMAHKHITWHMKPILSRCFEHYEALEYHLFANAPEMPDWLRAEFFATEKALAVYGELKTDASDGHLEHEVSIAIQIQSAFGQAVANEWVKSHREFYRYDNG